MYIYAYIVQARDNHITSTRKRLTLIVQVIDCCRHRSHAATASEAPVRWYAPPGTITQRWDNPHLQPFLVDSKVPNLLGPSLKPSGRLVTTTATAAAYNIPLPPPPIVAAPAPNIDHLNANEIARNLHLREDAGGLHAGMPTSKSSLQVRRVGGTQLPVLTIRRRRLHATRLVIVPPPMLMCRRRRLVVCGRGP